MESPGQDKVLTGKIRTGFSCRYYSHRVEVLMGSE